MNKKNIAYIDGQNLHIGVTSDNWKIDNKKFRTYLSDTYGVDEAYYFMGFLNEDHQSMYRLLQKAGFILEFREHTSLMMGKKKGNVDTDIVFEIMKKIRDERDDFDKIVLISGDGDYFKLVKYLIKEDLFEKLLMPNGMRASSLYNQIDSKFKLGLNRVKTKIEKK